MKNNQPVSQREVSFPSGCYLVSRTDLKGTITYANDAFVDISGYSREELIGNNHNIVRHPDMPEAAFGDLWATVKSGLPWRGLVKNRCKNGDFYWVEAFVVPLKKDGRIVGYQSVRTPAARDKRSAAEAAYAAAGQKGRLPASGRRTLALRARLWIATAIILALMLVTGAIGIHGVSDSKQQLQALYQEQLQPSNIASKMMFLLADNRSQIMLALQHDPASPNARLHEHPLSQHIDATLKNREEINALLTALQSLPQSARTRELLDRFAVTRERFSKEGINVARELLAEGKFLQTNEVLLKQINPLYADMKRDGEALIGEFAQRAEQNFVESEARYQSVRNLTVGSLVLTALLAVIGGALLVRAIVNPIRQAIAHFERIAEGRLTDDIDIGGRDETGLLM
jgi:PAS domain S-box-containing protein